MDDQCELGNVSDRSNLNVIGEKRGSAEVEHQHGSRKRVKMRDLEAVCRSNGADARDSKLSKHKEVSVECQFDEKEVSQVTELPRTLGSGASLAERTGRDSSHLVSFDPRSVDLNSELVIPVGKGHVDSQECSEDSDKLSIPREHEWKPDNNLTSRGIGVDLNYEDVSSSMNKDPFFPYKKCNPLKAGDASECGSTTGREEEIDSLRRWKEMKENGFLSASHGGIPIPKQRGRKSKNDVLKRKMEIAKKEQVDRFTKIAAPSGLLNGLNPGIINHVRNRKQVHSIIEALVKSEKLENSQAGSKKSAHKKSGATEIGNRKDMEIRKDAGMQGLVMSHVNGPPNAFPVGGQSRLFPTLLNKYRESDQNAFFDKFKASQSNLVSQEEKLALKLSSASKVSECESSLSNEDSASYLSAKAANVASQWLELVHQDIKGRLSALRRSKKRVRSVINTEMPFLLSKEFSQDQENEPHFMKNSAAGFSNSAAAVEMHQARWTKLFEQMDKALCEEEQQLENWLNQVREMQLHCEQGLRQAYNTVGTSDGDSRSQKADSSERREMAMRAAAAAIYSTCNFLLTDISCF
ncbi:hypothetical protein UlMin_026214 [Ulmus minor]